MLEEANRTVYNKMYTTAFSLPPTLFIAGLLSKKDENTTRILTHQNFFSTEFCF